MYFGSSHAGESAGARWWSTWFFVLTWVTLPEVVSGGRIVAKKVSYENITNMVTGSIIIESRWTPVFCAGSPVVRLLQILTK